MKKLFIILILFCFPISIAAYDYHNHFFVSTSPVTFEPAKQCTIQTTKPVKLRIVDRDPSGNSLDRTTFFPTFSGVLDPGQHLRLHSVYGNIEIHYQYWGNDKTYYDGRTCDDNIIRY
jgi:hypothetical protein